MWVHQGGVYEMENPEKGGLELKYGGEMQSLVLPY